MKRNALEWLILAGSVAALVAVAGYLLVQVVAGPPDRPEIVATLEVEAGHAAASGWAAPLVVRNDGGAAARTLVVEVRAAVDGREEVAVVTLDLLAPTSEATVMVGFSSRPGGEALVRVVSYEVP